MKKTKRIIFISVVLILIVVISFGGYMVYREYGYRKANSSEEKAIDQFRPDDEQSFQTDENGNTDWVNEYYNAINNVSSEYENEDIVGWIKMNDEIDYPFVQAEDNDYYLRRDLNSNYLQSGTVFLDWRCNADMSSFPNVIFGHNMKTKTKFGTLTRYKEAAYFDEHPTGWLFLKSDITYRVDVFAYETVKNTDSMIYTPDKITLNQKDAFLEYVKDNAEQYRDIGVTNKDNVLVLSTCSYDFLNARGVLIAKLTIYS